MSEAPEHLEHVLTGQDSALPEVFPVAGGAAAVFSARAPHKESGNEDAAGVFCVDSRRGILVVADGMGGAAAGERASAEAIGALRRALRRGGADGEELRSHLLDAFEDANQRILALGIGAATTLCVGELDGTCLRIYHAGDSAALVVGQRGRIKLQTIAHSPVGYAVESGLIDEADALHHGERHIVSNVIGSREMRIEIGSRIRLAPRDSALIASDGLFDNVSLDEITASIRFGPIQEAALRLAEIAVQRMQSPRAGEPSKSDDLSFVLYRPDPNGPRLR